MEEIVGVIREAAIRRKYWLPEVCDLYFTDKRGIVASVLSRKAALGYNILIGGLRLGLLGWYLLPNPQKFIDVIKFVKPEVLVEHRKPVGRWKQIIYSMMLLIPLVMLWIIERVLSYFGVAIDTFTWALMWSVTATVNCFWMLCYAIDDRFISAWKPSLSSQSRQRKR